MQPCVYSPWPPSGLRAQQEFTWRLCSAMEVENAVMAVLSEDVDSCQPIQGDVLTGRCSVMVLPVLFAFWRLLPPAVLEIAIYELMERPSAQIVDWKCGFCGVRVGQAKHPGPDGARDPDGKCNQQKRT